MVEGTKKTIIWESNNEPPKSYIWVKADGKVYEYDWDLREWVLSPNINAGGGIEVIVKTTAEWDSALGYIPAKGTVIVYSDHRQIEKDGKLYDVPGIKIGSGNAYVQDLIFTDISDEDITRLQEELDDHVTNTSIHVSEIEKLFWNNKVSIDESGASSEILIFRTD